ncbi:MAG: hypothetical protein H6Q69_2591 [Firmicutes bacterium]|nr:hypothetical protein [Bacillota bacterium]
MRWITLLKSNRAINKIGKVMEINTVRKQTSNMIGDMNKANISEVGNERQSSYDINEDINKSSKTIHQRLLEVGKVQINRQNPERVFANDGLHKIGERFFYVSLYFKENMLEQIHLLVEDNSMKNGKMSRKEK